jgi:hypothetical protein
MLYLWFLVIGINLKHKKMKYLIFYSSALEQSIISKEIAYLKCESDIAQSTSTSKAGSTITVKDVAGVTTGDMTTYIGTLASDVYSEIYITCLTNVTPATSKLSFDQIASLDAKLITANKGTVVLAGTLASNSTATEFVIPSGDSPSAVDDFYNGMYLKTVGTTAVYRYIKDYTGSGAVGVINTSTTALTTTETYTIYTNAHIFDYSAASSNKNACRVTWDALFPSTIVNPIVSMLGGYGSGFQPHVKITKTATAVAAGSISDTGEFTAAAYDGGSYYVGIESGTLGVGQIRRVVSNTADVLTLENSVWDVVTPTGTVVYQLTYGNSFTLYDKYLPYAIKTYLSANNDKTHATWREMFDRYGMSKIDPVAKSFTPNFALIDEYAAKGKAIFDAICAGIVS